MIYSDGIHLISDQGTSHLHEYCKTIGIKRCWFHSSKKFPHYDIPKLKRESFFSQNPDVIRVSSREIVTILKGIKKD